jgi:hypothetical protein
MAQETLLPCMRLIDSVGCDAATHAFAASSDTGWYFSVATRRL